jgi:hypothetical protein
MRGMVHACFILQVTSNCVVKANWAQTIIGRLPDSMSLFES